MDAGLPETKTEEIEVTEEPMEDPVEAPAEDEPEKTEEEEIDDIDESINMKNVRIFVTLALILFLIGGMIYFFWLDDQGYGFGGIYRLVAIGAFAPLAVILIFHIIHLILSKSNLKDEKNLIKKYPFKRQPRRKLFSFSLEGLKQLYKSEEEPEEVPTENSEEFYYTKAMYYEEELGVNSSKLVGTFLLLAICAGLGAFFINGHVLVFGIPLMILATIFGIIFILLFLIRRKLNEKMMEYVYKIKEQE